MAVIYKLAPGGHSVIVIEEGKSVSMAFDERIDAGWSMYDLSDPQSGKLLKEFDPTVSLIIAVPWRSQ